VVNKLGKLIDWEKINFQTISWQETYWLKQPSMIKADGNHLKFIADAVEDAQSDEG
jgi:hypothetical protein